MKRVVEKPEDFLPIGMIIKIGRHNLRVVIEEHVYDQHAFGGWGYRVAYSTGIRPTKGFLWPHGASKLSGAYITLLHPLEVLAHEAE